MFYGKLERKKYHKFLFITKAISVSHTEISITSYQHFHLSREYSIILNSILIRIPVKIEHLSICLCLYLFFMRRLFYRDLCDAINNVLFHIILVADYDSGTNT